MLPLLPVKPGWSRVRIVDFPRVASELYTGFRATDQGRLILGIPYGGIGDHLFYTAAASPEIIGHGGPISDIQISTHSKDNYGGALIDIIWKTNPCVGWRGEGKFTEIRGWTHSGARPRQGNFCDGIVAQLSGNIPEPGSTRPYLARTTPRPKWYEETPYVVIDMNRKSNRDDIDAHWAEITRHHNAVIRERYHSHAFAIYSSIINPYGRPQESDLGDYFSMVEHCDAFFGGYSGGAVLAAAYGKPAWIYCTRKDPAQSFVGHTYVEVGR